MRRLCCASAERRRSESRRSSLLAERRAEPWAVDVLRAAAAQALDRGGPDVAADLLARALEEPPPAEQRAEILAELGAAELHAGRPVGCESALNDPRDAAFQPRRFLLESPGAWERGRGETLLVGVRSLGPTRAGDEPRRPDRRLTERAGHAFPSRRRGRGRLLSPRS